MHDVLVRGLAASAGAWLTAVESEISTAPWEGQMCTVC